MSEPTAPPSVADALEAVAQEHGEEQERLQAELEGVDARIGEVQEQIATLQGQLDDLAQSRVKVEGQLESTAAGQHQRRYTALFGALRSQAQALRERAGLVAEAQKKRDADLLGQLDDPEIKRLSGEYEQFQTQVAPTLEALPDSYRSAIEEHHAQVTQQLRAMLEALDVSPATVEAPSLALDVVTAVDAPEGNTEVVMLVLPVIEQTQTQWTERDEDVQTWVAARVMQAVYHVCHRIGLPGAQAMYGGHQGLLAVEIELGSGDPAEVATALQETMDQVLADAPELIGAQVAARALAVDVDNLFPPEEPGEAVLDAPDAPVQQEAGHA